MCSESEQSSYQSEVTRYCKGPDRKCPPNSFDQDEIDCNDLKARLEVAENCVKARDDVMLRCFKGGDEDHRSTRRDAAGVRDRCSELITYKRGVNACYNCSPSDYESYRNDQRRACERPKTCEERKDDAKVNCSKLEEKLENGKECLKAQNYIVDRCFDGRRNSRRELLRQETKRAIENCREVLDYKRNNKLCE